MEPNRDTVLRNLKHYRRKFGNELSTVSGFGTMQKWKFTLLKEMGAIVAIEGAWHIARNKKVLLVPSDTGFPMTIHGDSQHLLKKKEEFERNGKYSKISGVPTMYIFINNILEEERAVQKKVEDEGGDNLFDK